MPAELPRLIATRSPDGDWNCHIEGRPKFVMRGRQPLDAMSKICSMAGFMHGGYAVAESGPDRVVYAWSWGALFAKLRKPCPDCGGSGNYVGLAVVEECRTCAGSGRVPG